MANGLPSGQAPSRAADATLGDFDVAIVGAGMAGASLACALAGELRVLLLEQETQPGYHSTGRSAALFSEVYGNESVRALSRASRAFFDAPGEGFPGHALLTPRGTVFFASAGQLEQLHALHDEVAPRDPALRWLQAAELSQCLPALRAQVAHAGVFEPGACDIDVHSLHHGFLRGARRGGAQVLCLAQVEQASESHGKWTLRTRAGSCSASLLVNAAGAWADELAALAGVAPLGLTPMRRTALVFEDESFRDCRHWPLAVDVDEQLYFKPDAGRLLASPADETASPACDAQPDEYDVALLLERLERMTLLRPKRITARWAGLRTFASDRTPVAGFDGQVPNFFWMAGQGGYGIQTAPALAALSASLILRRSMPRSLAEQGVVAQRLSPQRFAPTGRSTD